MKRTVLVVFGSALLNLSVCIVEWLIWDYVPQMSGFDGYNLWEKAFFVVLFSVNAIAVFILINGKNVIIDAVTFWLFFVLTNSVMGLRTLIAELTENTYVYGPNFLGDDIWVVCYIGCIVGTIIAVVVGFVKNEK